jgi:hypothetical protein
MRSHTRVRIVVRAHCPHETGNLGRKLSGNAQAKEGLRLARLEHARPVQGHRLASAVAGLLAIWGYGLRHRGLPDVRTRSIEVVITAPTGPPFWIDTLTLVGEIDPDDTPELFVFSPDCAARELG